MPRPRFHKLPLEKRERILHVAARRFGEQGYRDASLNQILEECEVSKGAAYYYFDGKADLFGAVVEHVLAEAFDELDLGPQRLDRRSFWPRLAEVQTRWMERVSKEPWMGGLARAVWKTSDEVRQHPELKAALERGRSLMTRLIERGQQIGAVRTDLPAELLSDLVASVDQASDRWMAENWERLTSKQREAISTALFRALRRLLQPTRRRP